MLVLQRDEDEIVDVVDNLTGQTILTVTVIRGQRVRLGFEADLRYSFVRPDAIKGPRASVAAGASG